VFSQYIPRTFMASAERTGATLFKDELNLSKNNMIGLLSRTDDSTSHSTPWAVLKENYRRGYALPVNDNIRFVNTLSQLQGRPGKLLQAHPELLEELQTIVGGNYVTNSDGLTQFMPDSSTTRLYLTEASSAARSLLVLWYWLIGDAAAGDILMIDEPEMNLHPANQCRLARWLAHLVNCGVQVFISTHSDYIVKEFNTLIMLSQRTQAISAIAVEAGYAEHCFLSLDQVRLYSCESVAQPEKGIVLREADKSAHLGLEVPTFDKTIDAMNELQNRLYYAPADQDKVAA
jgi:AAA domain, putative AbiEii toxin, Type IV TA system